MLHVFTVLQMRHTSHDRPGESVDAVNGRVGGMGVAMKEVGGTGMGGAVTPERRYNK